MLCLIFVGFPRPVTDRTLHDPGVSRASTGVFKSNCNVNPILIHNPSSTFIP